MRRLPLVLLAGLSTCEAPPPTYDVQPPVLRLLADEGTLPLGGGSVFVVVELGQTDGGPRTLYLQASGARSVALPGPSHCGPPPTSPDAGKTPALADAGGDDGGSLDGGADSGISLGQGDAELIIPFVALRFDEAIGTYETAVLVTAGAGMSDVIVVASAYRALDATSCVQPSAPLDAFAVLRIPRKLPTAPDAGNGSDAGPADAGLTDAGSDDAGEPDAGRPDAGMLDAGFIDGGASDSGLADAGAPDGGSDGGSDAGTADAGTNDAGNPDAGDGG